MIKIRSLKHNMSCKELIIPHGASFGICISAASWLASLPSWVDSCTFETPHVVYKQSSTTLIFIATAWALPYARIRLHCENAEFMARPTKWFCSCHNVTLWLEPRFADFLSLAEPSRDRGWAGKPTSQRSQAGSHWVSFARLNEEKDMWMTCCPLSVRLVVHRGVNVV